MEDITWIIELIFAVITLVLTRYAFPWFKKRLATVNNSELDYWLEVAVLAAEETYKNTAKAGAKKRQEAIAFLRKKGYTVDEEQLQIMIKAKVRALFNWDDYGDSGSVTDSEEASEEALEA